MEEAPQTAAEQESLWHFCRRVYRWQTPAVIAAAAACILVTVITQLVFGVSLFAFLIVPLGLVLGFFGYVSRVKERDFLNQFAAIHGYTYNPRGLAGGQ